jgi:adenylate cyclase, class 2
MPILNFEFKARTANLEKAEQRLLRLNPQFIGEDQQRDTYFNVDTGRLKLREGNIENALIWYMRNNVAAARQSDVLLYPHDPDKRLMDILVQLHGVKVVVEKVRRIYYIGNVKFHFDKITRLGNFIEVEAIDKDGNKGIRELQKQCNTYAELFNIQPGDYVSVSYSDLLLAKDKETQSRAGNTSMHN